MIILSIIWFLIFFLPSRFRFLFLPITLASLPPGVMFLNCSTALRDGATDIKKTYRKGTLEREWPNRSVVKKYLVFVRRPPTPANVFCKKSFSQNAHESQRITLTLYTLYELCTTFMFLRIVYSGLKNDQSAFYNSVSKLATTVNTWKMNEQWYQLFQDVVHTVGYHLIEKKMVVGILRQKM